MGKELVGRRGRRGPKGKRGVEGKRGAPGVEPAEIHGIIASVEKLQDETGVTVKRIAQIQLQIDQDAESAERDGRTSGASAEEALTAPEPPQRHILSHEARQPSMLGLSTPRQSGSARWESTLSERLCHQCPASCPTTPPA